MVSVAAREAHSKCVGNTHVARVATWVSFHLLLLARDFIRFLDDDFIVEDNDCERRVHVGPSAP